MSRHTKLAIFIAPFLLLLGYIASDYYLEQQAQELRIFELVPQGDCDVINKQCVLSSGDFKVNISDLNGMTEVNSTFPLDDATLFLVEGEKATSYRLGMSESPYYWRNKTPLRAKLAERGSSQKMRLIASIKGGKYISEFYATTTH
ncbi:hypothetical protein J7384_08160 [Endozoicomonas sp. G2_1]|uniref:hypothetical protein n=1 Tax=Endozoicomonas sp. G2_1 TaxID=2821091 RepID=UPI001ADCB999|nr:hypothetical protein [Endozoicomonas sp. G2_1]MBO9490331.1 hypothetical protein [Endozoicomonas sp. G2_1]